MSAEVAAELPLPATGILSDARVRGGVRFALGATLATGLAYLIGFELPFLVPVLVAVLLGSKAPCPTFRVGIEFVAAVAAGAFVGVVLTRYLLQFPLIFLLIEFLVLYRIFYALAGGASPLRMIWLLIAALIIPLMGLLSIGLSVGVALGLVKGAAIAVGVVWLSFGLLPDLQAPASPTTGELKPKPAKQSPPPEARAAYARRAVTVVFPLLVLFYVKAWTGDAVVLVYAGILALLPSFAAGWNQGKTMVVGNLLGGVTAIAFYNLLLIWPSITTFLLLTFVAGLVFAEVIFSDRQVAPMFKTAFNAVVLVVGMSVASTSADASSKFYTRIVQIMLAVLYVAAAFGWLEYLQRKRVTS